MEPTATHTPPRPDSTTKLRSRTHTTPSKINTPKRLRVYAQLFETANRRERRKHSLKTKLGTGQGSSVVERRPTCTRARTSVSRPQRPGAAPGELPVLTSAARSGLFRVVARPRPARLRLNAVENGQRSYNKRTGAKLTEMWCYAPCLSFFSSAFGLS